jgi:hypothetical protein
MIEWIVVHQALIREVINGFCMILFLTLSLMVLVFMWDTWIASNSTRDWRGAPGMPTACALWWVFAAETYRTGAVWVLYNIGRSHNTSPYPTANNIGIGVFGDAGYWSTFGYLIAGFMLVGGLQRAIYIFTPPSWNRRIWLYSTLSASVFCASPYIISLALRIYIDGL